MVSNKIQLLKPLTFHFLYLVPRTGYMNTQGWCLLLHGIIHPYIYLYICSDAAAQLDCMLSINSWISTTFLNTDKTDGLMLTGVCTL